MIEEEKKMKSPSEVRGEIRREIRTKDFLMSESMSGKPCQDAIDMGCQTMNISDLKEERSDLEIKLEVWKRKQ